MYKYKQGARIRTIGRISHRMDILAHRYSGTLYLNTYVCWTGYFQSIVVVQRLKKEEQKKNQIKKKKDFVIGFHELCCGLDLSCS